MSAPIVPDETLRIGDVETGVVWITESRRVRTAAAAECEMGGAWRVVAEVHLAPGDWVDKRSREWSESGPDAPGARRGWRLVNPLPERILDAFDDLVPNPHHDPAYVARRLAYRPLHLGPAPVLSLEEVTELRDALPAGWEPPGLYVALERRIEPDDPFDAYHLFDIKLRGKLEDALGDELTTDDAPGYRMIRVALGRILDVHPSLIADVLRGSRQRWRQTRPSRRDLFGDKRRTMSDENESFSFDPSETEDGPEQPEPTYRATIRRGRVAITYWADWLAQGGAWNWMLDARGRAGVAIADLTLAGEGDSEIVVRYLSEGRSRAEADEALRRWADDLGYRRIWLPSGPVELGAEPPVGRRAEVRCPTCGSRWHDSTAGFWELVRREGSFPRWCLVCGWELPQWQVEAADEKPAEDELEVEVTRPRGHRPRGRRPASR